jgi:hypothetical protein
VSFIFMNLNPHDRYPAQNERGVGANVKALDERRGSWFG